MIVCRACGARNPVDEEFCSNCGRYLEWAGEHVELPPEPEPEPEVEPAPEEEKPPPGFFRRVANRLGIDHHDEEPPEDVDMSGWREAAARMEATTAHRDDAVVATAFGASIARNASRPPTAAGGISARSIAERVAEADATTEVPEVAGEQAPITEEFARITPSDEEDETRAGSAGALVATGLTTASLAAVAPSTEPMLRRPGDPLPVVDRSERGTVLRRPTEVPRSDRRRPAGRRGVPLALPSTPESPAPGDVFCPRCNQFNSPTRVFCRRCGERLPHIDENVAYAYDPIPFVRRHRHRDAKIVAVGERPGVWGKRASGGGNSGRTMAIMARVGAVVIGIGLVLSFIGPYSEPIRHWYTNTFNHIENKVNVTYTQQFAIGANASTSLPNHLAALAVDDASNTYWQSLPSKKAKGAAQTLTVVFASKTNIDRVGILSGAGPAQSTFLSQSRPESVLLTFSNGYTITEHLKDETSFQTLAVKAKGVVSMKLQVLTVYPSTKGNSVAITELEFYERS